VKLDHVWLDDLVGPFLDTLTQLLLLWPWLRESPGLKRTATSVESDSHSVSVDDYAQATLSGQQMTDADQLPSAETVPDSPRQAVEGASAVARSSTGSALRKSISDVRSLRSRVGPRLIRSLIAVLVGSLILRLAGLTMGQMTQFYLDYISRHYYHISFATRGYVIGAFFITEVIGALVLGAMSDRYGRKLFIILGPVFGAIAVQLTAMTSVLWLLVFARLIEGASTGSSVPATLGYISDVTVGRPNLRARVMGLFEITLVGGTAMGAVVGGYLWKFFGRPQTFAGVELLSPAFSINGLIYLASLAIFLWGLSDVKGKVLRPVSETSYTATARQTLKHYYDVFRSPSVLMFSPAWLSIFSIIGLWINHSVGLLTGKDHFQSQLLTGTVAPEKFGNGFAALAVFFALGVLAWSFVLGRYRKTNVMLISTLGLFALLLTVFGLNHFGSFSSPFYYLLLGALLIELLVLSGFTPAALTYLADVTENYAADRGSIMGLYSVFLGVGQLIGTSIGGYFADWNGVDGLLVLSAMLGIITAISLLALRRREATIVSVADPFIEPLKETDQN
jgi:MFS family permease